MCCSLVLAWYLLLRCSPTCVKPHLPLTGMGKQKPSVHKQVKHIRNAFETTTDGTERHIRRMRPCGSSRWLQRVSRACIWSSTCTELQPFASSVIRCISWLSHRAALGYLARSDQEQAHTLWTSESEGLINFSNTRDVWVSLRSELWILMNSNGLQWSSMD